MGLKSQFNEILLVFETVMAYHHVLLTLADAPDKPRCVLLDLTEKQLQIQFVTPYEKGKDILCGSEIIRISNIKRIQIIRTGKTNEIERNDFRERISQENEEFNRQSNSSVIIGIGCGYEPEDITEAGEDVTTQYISGLPGHASSNTFRELINHPWVITIGGGLIVAALVWWFRWNSTR